MSDRFVVGVNLGNQGNQGRGIGMKNLNGYGMSVLDAVLDAVERCTIPDRRERDLIEFLVGCCDPEVIFERMQAICHEYGEGGGIIFESGGGVRVSFPVEDV
jgi:hypothetical protein